MLLFFISLSRPGFARLFQEQKHHKAVTIGDQPIYANGRLPYRALLAVLACEVLTSGSGCFPSNVWPPENRQRESEGVVVAVLSHSRTCRGVTGNLDLRSHICHSKPGSLGLWDPAKQGVAAQTTCVSVM
ncbi:hypothetical protein HO173_002417 [Letharia columbiana]|uniref:Uncharacterized protein n=1 Tax=Letharia columbiana TaxID=112416 RepID=A0A8H6L8W5_9LECA|nr:uncharacterized protein HO173_002417 [Letharia columbiana]KAF6239870.1 hypothetical protein HO173_002417 [Letharia columbiana]